MRRFSIVALCVVAALGASVMTPTAAERTSFHENVRQSIARFVTAMLAPSGDPVQTPLPIAKPDRDLAEKPALAPGVVAQCGHASIVESAEGGAAVFRAVFAPTMVDDMASQGCSQFFQGCNVCSIRYTGCEDAEREACTDAACLEKTCERQVLCSAKSCSAKGKALSCDSRLARTACLKTAF